MVWLILAPSGQSTTGREGPPVGAWGRQVGPKVDAAPGLPGRSPIPVLFRPKGA